MATAADQRLLELLEKWLGSLDRHLQYASLDNDAYWKVQAWVEHQRPTRWIVELARQRTLALKTLLEERIAAGDASFGDALELSIFLANLVGSQHIERFIPLAEPEPPPAAAPARATEGSDSSTTATREMPQSLRTRPHGDARAESKPAAPKPAAAKPTAAKPTAAKPAAPKPATPKPAAAKPTAAKPSAPRPDAAKPATPGTPVDQVLADAARLIQWGRQWYELPELIARMADRPSLAEVRRILTENKARLERPTRPA